MNCQPSNEPTQAITANAITIWPTSGLNIFAKTRPKGPVDCGEFGVRHDALDHGGGQDVDHRRTERAEHAGQRHVALGVLDRVAFCAADSMPRNAHSVSEMLEPMPSPMLRPFGFQAAVKVSALNQNQPTTARSPPA